MKVFQQRCSSTTASAHPRRRKPPPVFSADSRLPDRVRRPARAGGGHLPDTPIMTYVSEQELEALRADRKELELYRAEERDRAQMKARLAVLDTPRDKRPKGV